MAERSSRGSRARSRAGALARSGAGRSARNDPHPDLDLDEDCEAQQRVWNFERISWWFVALLLLSAVLGFFGRGPLSRTYQVNRQAPMALEYDRFGRQSSESQMFIHLFPGSAGDGQARVWIDRGLIDGVTELQFTPEPVEAAAGAGRVVYRFAVPEPRSPALIDVQYKPERPGRLSGKIGLEGRPPIDFRQFIYPRTNPDSRMHEKCSRLIGHQEPAADEPPYLVAIVPLARGWFLSSRGERPTWIP